MLKTRKHTINVPNKQTNSLKSLDEDIKILKGTKEAEEEELDWTVKRTKEADEG